MRCKLFGFALLFRLSTGFAQDAPYTDTVIVIKEPYIMTKKVYTNVPAHTLTDSTQRWSLELFGATGRASFSSSGAASSVFGKVFEAGLLLTYSKKHFEFGVGGAILKGDVDISTTGIKTLVSTRDSSYQRLLDSYIQQINGKDSVFYVYEQRDTSFATYSSQASTQIHKKTYSYFRIPLSIGYTIFIVPGKLFVIPRLQIIGGLRTSPGDATGENPAFLLWNVAGQASIGYHIGARIALTGGVKWQKNLSAFSTGESFPKSVSVLSYSAGLSLFF